jgi:hypothetical protein
MRDVPPVLLVDLEMAGDAGGARHRKSARRCGQGVNGKEQA